MHLVLNTTQTCTFIPVTLTSFRILVETVRSFLNLNYFKPNCFSLGTYLICLNFIQKIDKNSDYLGFKHWQWNHVLFIVFFVSPEMSVTFC